MKISKIFRLIKNSNIKEFIKLSIKDYSKINHLGISVLFYACCCKNKNAYYIVKHLISLNITDIIDNKDFNQIFKNTGEYSYKIIEILLSNSFIKDHIEYFISEIITTICCNTEKNSYKILDNIIETYNLNSIVISPLTKSKFIRAITANNSINSYKLLESILNIDNFIKYDNLVSCYNGFYTTYSILELARNNSLNADKMMAILLSKLEYKDIIIENKLNENAFIISFCNLYSTDIADLLFPYFYGDYKYDKRMEKRGHKKFSDYYKEKKEFLDFTLK